LSWIFLHRTTPDGTLSDWLTVLGTAADTPQSFTVTSLDLSLDLDAECFTLVQVDPAGGRVSSAESRCATLTTLHPPLDENSTRGCMTAPSAPPAAITCLLLLPAIVIRRRKGAC
ncbi:MAG: hypothetical protein GXP62_10525, partial [Oligoflexia bacterium]|nr:hypothetical protein [Oligoflexia bacterium]